MNPLAIKIRVPNYGECTADSIRMDEALAHYSLATVIQLRAVMCNLFGGSESFTEFDSRTILIIMICDHTLRMALSVRQTIPGKVQARKIVDDAYRREYYQELG